MTAAGVVYLIVMLVALALFIFYAKSGRLLKCVLFTAFTGLVAFGVVFTVARIAGLPIAPTPFAMLVSGFLGVPGVIAMLVLNLM